jgi:peptidyl-tRNA hydrolase, PTH1 family
MTEINAIIGLGNPGNEYSLTRHNIGYLVVDFLADKFRCQWKSGKGRFRYCTFNLNGRRILLIRSTTFMNDSGIALLKALETFDIVPEQVLVVLDDFALPFGALRMRKNGSDGGHNGLASILYHIQTDKIPRLRVGIGSILPQTDPADYVLGDFDAVQQKELPELVKKAADAIVYSIVQNLDRAMELFNRTTKQPV